MSIRNEARPLDWSAAITDKSVVAGDASAEEGLRASRARLLARADADRREIERALHDGVQQDLVALAVRLQLARRLGGSDPAAALEVLDEAANELHEALQSLRLLSERIYPSILDARGLTEALRGLAASADVRLEAEGLGRYSPEIERALYFCCRETLESAEARGLRVWEEEGCLCFEAAFGAKRSADVSPLCDRIDTLGGRLTIDGRRISATIPLAEELLRRDRE